MRYEHIVRYVSETPWAITPGMLAVITDLLAYRAAGGELTADEVAARIAAAGRAPRTARTAGAVAVLPLLGVVSHRMNLMSELSGGTSTEAFGRQFRQALADPEIGAIVLDVDSPGGSVDGVPELADAIYGARGQKPVVAVANSLAASAAYWIATAADELVVTPSGEVGSIGVLTAHTDYSAAMERGGIRVSYISAGKYKTEGNPYEPLGDEARAAIQERVDAYYDLFVAAVARHRGVKTGEVRSGYGEGRVVGARRAVALGMADRVATLDETIDRLAHGRRAGAGRAASAAGDIELRRRRLRLAER